MQEWHVKYTLQTPILNKNVENMIKRSGVILSVSCIYYSLDHDPVHRTTDYKNLFPA